jgi:hypothetical protein
VPEPGADVEFTFTINNLSTVDTVTINSLTDDIYGDLNGQGDCSVPQVLAPGNSYSCNATFYVDGDAGDVETNVATASGIDDDVPPNPVSDDDDATVNITNVPPAASLDKAATLVCVTYVVTVTNESTAEALTLDSLIDDVYGNITGNPLLEDTDCAVPQTLQPKGQSGDSYTCTFEACTSTSPTKDTVTGTVSDNEGGSVTPSDCAEVTFGDPASCSD